MNVEDRRPHQLPYWVNRTASGIWWEVPRLGQRIRVEVTADRVRLRRSPWIGTDEHTDFPLQGILRVYLDRDASENLVIACRIPQLLGKDRHELPVQPAAPYQLHPLVELLRELVDDADAQKITEQERADRAALRELTRQRTRSG